MDELISRHAAIDAFNTNIDEVVVAGKENADAVERYLNRVIDEIEQLPPIQPVIVPCDYAKACNEATMNKLTSAVAYYDALEELRKHGYVLVDMER